MNQIAVPRNKKTLHVLSFPGEPSIELIARTRHIALLEEAITEERLLAVKTRAEYLAKILDAQKIQFVLAESGIWLFNYLYTTNGKIIGTPEAYDNREKALHVLNTQGKKRALSKKSNVNQKHRSAERSSTHMSFNAPVDFLIIAPLPEECEALLAALSPSLRPEKATKTTNDQHIYYQIKVPFVDNGADEIYRVVVAPLRKMGQKEAASTTASALRRWRPNYVVVVGIAGGTRQAGVKLGDIVIADMIVDYEMQKLTESGQQIRYEGDSTDRDLLGAAKSVNAGWHQKLQSIRPDQEDLELHFGPMLSGDKVVATEDGIWRYRSDWPKMIGLEMEAAGVLSACRDLPAKRRPGVFMIRGVSDLADENKNREEVKPWRAYAVSVAAEFLLHLLRSAPTIPVVKSFKAPSKKSSEDQ